MEHKALQHEIENIKQWHLNYGVYLDQYYLLINNWLFEKSDTAIKNLVALFKKEDFLKNYYRDTTIAQMSIIIDIFCLEKQLNIPKTIIDHGSTINELIDFYSTIKFNIWHMEFERDKNAIHNFLDFLSKTSLSIPALIRTIHICAFHRINAAYNISYIIRQYHAKITDAYEILKYAHSMAPNDEQIIYELADICWEQKSYDLMAEWRRKITEPKKAFEAYEKKWSKE